MEDVLKIIQGLATAIVSVTIAAAVSYETGYFSIIGYKYQSVLSATDYVSGALEWLPWLFLLYGLGFLLTGTSSSKLVEIVMKARTERPRAFWTVVLLLSFAATAIIVVVPFYLVLLYAPVAVLPLVAIPLFRQLARPSPSVRRGTAFVASSIVVLLALFCSGVGRAHQDLKIIENAYVIWSNEDRTGVQILRTLGKGLLIWNPTSSRAEFLRWEKVDRLSHPIWRSYDAPWLDSLGCRIWSRLCHHEPPPSP